MIDVQDRELQLEVRGCGGDNLMEVRASRALSITPHGVKQLPNGNWALAPAACSSLRSDVKAVLAAWVLIVPAAYAVALLDEPMGLMAVAPAWFICVVMAAIVTALLIEHWSFRAYKVTHRKGTGAVEAVKRMGGIWAGARWSVPRAAIERRNEAMSIGHAAMMLFFPALAGLYAGLLYYLGQKPNLMGVGLVLSVPVGGAIVMALGDLGMRLAVARGRRKARAE